MEFDLRTALDALRQRGTVFQVANDARPPEAYVFSAFLPEEKKYSYQATSGSMTVRATMAGLVGMDSPYPLGGAIEVSKFSEETAKIAIRVPLPERDLRELQEALFRLTLQGANTLEAVQQTALNFEDHLIVQPMLDTTEYLRGRALVFGMIDWTFNGVRLLVDYGVPSANILPARTGANGYGGSTSKFWEDVALQRQRLRNTIVARIMHTDTKEVILANPVNNIELVAEDLDRGTFSVRRYKIVGGVPISSTDPRDKADFITYDSEGEIWDLTAPGKTKLVRFMPAGAITAIGRFNAKRFVIGAGAQTPPNPNGLEIGYTHLAPTVESFGRPGRWSDVRTPDDSPWMMEGRGAMNGIPVIEKPELVSTATTEMP
jgi:hypothetical protein